MSVIAKSVVFDIADSWTGSSVGVRSIEFKLAGVLIDIADADITCYATTYWDAQQLPSFAFITSLSKTGDYKDTSWGASSDVNQRLIVVFDVAQEFDEIVINNFHSFGEVTAEGIKNTVITSSTDAISDTTYNAAIANSTVLFTVEIAQHVASNVIDDQSFVLPFDGIITAPEVSIPIVVDSNVGIQIAVPDLPIPITIGEPSFFVGVPLTAPEISILTDVTAPVINLIISAPETEIPVTVDSAIYIILIPPEINIVTGISAPGVSIFSMAGTIVRYLLTVTGAADSLSDLALPLSSFQARRKSGEPTYLSVVIPTMDYATEIAARSNGTIKVEQAFDFNGDYIQRELILEAEIDNIHTYEGGRNQSVIIDGYKTTTHVAKAVTLTTSTYRALSGGKLRYRVAEPNVFINPGDTITIGSDTFTIGVMSYAISPTMQQIELEEA